tara:strand:- start:80 stop:319 length:240 start_codon:yes stop_codon:yes gene_type:complete
MAIVQLEKMDHILEMRLYIANLFDEVVKVCPWLMSLKIEANTESSYWTYVFYINETNNKVNWHSFKSMFIEYGGGHGFY